MATPEFRHRLDLLTKLCELASALAGGKYHVQRGPVNYPTHDWTTKPFALSVSMAEYSMFPPQGDPFRRGSFMVELTTKIEGAAEIPGFRDSVLDALSVDAETLIVQLQAARKVNSDPYVIRITGDVKARELVNRDWSIQGIDVTVPIDY